MAEEQQLDASLDLMRRLPPAKAEENLGNLVDLLPDLAEDLLSAIDQPLKIAKCSATHKPYLLCDYNRDGDSYRSPWSNKYNPPLADGACPSEKLRKLEVLANDAFDTYRELYFEGGYSSVYMWDLEDGFAAAILLKKVNDDSAKVKGSWDGIHIIEVAELAAQKSARYKLTSTILLTIVHGKPVLGKMSLGGSLTRQQEQILPLEGPTGHIANLGRMVEDMENKLRNALNEIYFGKTKDIVNDLRSVANLSDRKSQEDLRKELAGKLGK